MSLTYSAIHSAVSFFVISDAADVYTHSRSLCHILDKLVQWQLYLFPSMYNTFFIINTTFQLKERFTFFIINTTFQLKERFNSPLVLQR